MCDRMLDVIYELCEVLNVLSHDVGYGITKFLQNNSNKKTQLNHLFLIFLKKINSLCTSLHSYSAHGFYEQCPVQEAPLDKANTYNDHTIHTVQCCTQLRFSRADESI
jgi:hypothetical protein